MQKKKKNLTQVWENRSGMAGPAQGKAGNMEGVGIPHQKQTSPPTFRHSLPAASQLSRWPVIKITTQTPTTEQSSQLFIPNYKQKHHSL